MIEKRRALNDERAGVSRAANRPNVTHPPLVNIVRPSVSSPTGFSEEIDENIAGGEGREDVKSPPSLDLEPESSPTTSSEINALLPKKRTDENLGKLNDKKPLATTHYHQIESLSKESKQRRSLTVFDISNRLLKKQELRKARSPPGSTASLNRYFHPLASSSETATESSHLLPCRVFESHKKRSSVDTIPSLFNNLAGTTESNMPKRDSRAASVRSRRTTDSVTPRTEGPMPDGQKLIRGRMGGSMLARELSTNSEPIEHPVPGQLGRIGSPGIGNSQDRGLNRMKGKLSTTSLSPLCKGDIDKQEAAQNQLSGGQKNPLYQVSSDMLRITGYSTQFRNLLSRRDDHTDSSNLLRETSVANISTAGDGDPEFAKQNGGVQFTGIEDVEDGQKPNPNPVRRQDTRYGISISSDSAVKQKMKIRKKLYEKRQKLCDYSLLFAVVGVALTVLEAELTAAGIPGVGKEDIASQLLRVLILLSTIILMIFIVLYHATEIKIAVIDSGADDWRVAITWTIIRRIGLELFICGVCPVPGSGEIMWPYLQPKDHRTIIMSPVPIDVILSIPMFFRSYLLARFMVIHSRQFQDAATRSIAALNRVGVDFKFVVKTMMMENPLRVLILFTICYWVSVAWMLTQCDRYGMPPLEEGEQRHTYLNSLWLIIVTFMSIGYGDVVPNTYCGRSVAIATGIVGAGVSSALIAVISRKLELTRAEKHVNNFMSDSKLSTQRKDAAASVLQQTWFIHKYKTLDKARDEVKVRLHQRKFLHAINEFRRVKWDQRRLAEQGNDLIDVGKVQSDLHESLWEMQRTQENLITQIDHLTHKILDMQGFVVHQSLEMERMMSQVHSAIAGVPQRSSASTDTFISKSSKPGFKQFNNEDYVEYDSVE